MPKTDVAEELRRRKLHKVHWFLSWRLKMVNKAGEKYLPSKTIEKFIRGYFGAAVCTVLLYVLFGKHLPAEGDVAKLQELLLLAIPAVSGAIEALLNVIKFLFQKPKEVK